MESDFSIDLNDSCHDCESESGTFPTLLRFGVTHLYKNQGGELDGGEEESRSEKVGQKVRHDFIKFFTLS